MAELGGVNPTKQTQPVQDRPLNKGGVTKPTTSGGLSPSIGGISGVSK